MYLAIDTATDDAGLAIYENGQAIDEVGWSSGQNHTTELLPRLNNLLEKNGLKPADIKGIIVARGPGSFNGLRVGLSTAKGLAYSLKIPIAGINSLAAESCRYAEAGPSSVRRVAAVFEAGRGELATAIYGSEGGKWQQLTAEHITTAIALASETNEETVFCGEMAEETISTIREGLGNMAVFPPTPIFSRVACLARLGAARLDAGHSDDVASLSVLYLKRPPITEARKMNYPILK